MNAKTVLLTTILTAAGATAQTDFKSYINGTDMPTVHSTWGIFLGMTQTESNIDGYLHERIAEGTWMNPFTGAALNNINVYAFGQDNPILEAARVVTDHLDIHALDAGTAADLSAIHHSFDNLICHSNGCTVAISDIMSGEITVKHLYAMGTDWSTASLDPAKMNGTKVTFFVNKTDPVPLIPAPSIQRITDRTPGLGYTIRFGPDDPNSDSGSVRFIVLNQPPTHILLKAHDIAQSYFPAVRAWIGQDGPDQGQIRADLNLPPIKPPKPPAAPSSTAHSQSPSSKPGGVFADVPISGTDFAPAKGVKK